MSVWELLAITLSAAGLFAAILWAFVTYAVRENREASRDQPSAIGQIARARLAGASGIAAAGRAGASRRQLRPFRLAR